MSNTINESFNSLLNIVLQRSQSYVQAIQRKVIPGMMSNIGETSTLQSDATHLTTLPVDQNTRLPSSESTSNTVDSGVAVQFDAGY